MHDVQILKGGARFSVEGIRRVVASACERVGAERAILFGSYARGTADAWSDVDLLIVCATREPFLERFRLFPEILEALPGCELLVYTPAEIEERRARGGVVGRAVEEGILLHERAEPRRAS